MPPFRPKQLMPVPAPDRADRELLARRVDRRLGMRLGDRHRLDVVQVAVVALQHDRIDRRGLPADLRIGGDRAADQRIGAGADGEGVGQQDRRLQRAEFVHLHQADALAEAVQHRRGRDRLVAEQVAVVRQDGGDAGAHVALDQRGVADQ